MTGTRLRNVLSTFSQSQTNFRSSPSVLFNRHIPPSLPSHRDSSHQHYVLYCSDKLFHQCSPMVLPLLEDWDMKTSPGYRLPFPGESLALALLWDPLFSPGNMAPLLMIIGGMLWARLMWLFRLYFRPNIIPQTIHRNGFNFRWTLLKWRLRFWARDEPRNTFPHTWHDTCWSLSGLTSCWCSPNSPFSTPEINTVLQFEYGWRSENLNFLGTFFLERSVQRLWVSLTPFLQLWNCNTV